MYLQVCGSPSTPPCLLSRRFSNYLLSVVVPAQVPHTSFPSSLIQDLVQSVFLNFGDVNRCLQRQAMNIASARGNKPEQNKTDKTAVDQRLFDTLRPQMLDRNLLDRELVSTACSWVEAARRLVLVVCQPYEVSQVPLGVSDPVLVHQGHWVAQRSF